MLFARHRLMIVLLALLPVLAWADADMPRQLSVSGEAERLVSPDIAKLRLSVEGRAAAADGAMTEAASRTQSVIDALGTLTPLKHIRATETQLRQVVKGTTRTWRRDSGEPVEMLATRAIQVEHLDIEQLPEAMQLLARQDLSRIDQVSTTLAAADQVQDELLLEAVDDARARARRIAERLDVQLGLPLSVSTEGAPVAQPKFAVRAMAMESHAGAGYEATGQQSLSARVQIVFELEAP